MGGWKRTRQAIHVALAAVPMPIASASAPAHDSHVVGFMV
ncbi:Hypothetical protein A7982_11668 [Minicystis rosea]|nr:Hypothetical protein A7982_11668 [Minicystis rosea]